MKSQADQIRAACVVTTINKPTTAIRALRQRFPKSLIVVGDEKTHSDWHLNNVRYISPKEDSPFAYAHHAPLNHYARKNLGYLLAIARKSTVIYDTDDDNIPNKAWRVRNINSPTQLVRQKGWCNVYKLFSKTNAWPRGFSLEHCSLPKPELNPGQGVLSPIQQGLSDESPDVDAIWRMATPSPFLTFRKKLSVCLMPEVWCPFNSQSTWWWPQAYPLMYLPTHAPFRMTDIWRSFIAQRCLWEYAYGVAFHSPAEVTQKRNAHCLYRDFKDEIPGYLNNPKIVEVLSKTTLTGSMCDNLLTCYVALIEAELFPAAELNSVYAWITDVRVWRLGQAKSCGDVRRLTVT